MSSSLSLLHEFTQGVTPEFADIVTSLVKTISSSPVKLDAAIKWKQLTFGLPGDLYHWICSINITKKSVDLNFHYGGLLSDPSGIFRAGDSKFLRKIEYRTIADVDDAVVLDFIRQALDKHQYFKENWRSISRNR
ncbi:MAG TPA: DUF1801 domain-containing protein [Roseiflexaceae bacterium]|nr:DUF1801 domain-containing protein [Roseiflexaceae bacterium]